MKIIDIAFTCYAVTNIERSRKFYEGILGLVPNNDFPATPGSMWVEYNIGSGALSIGCSPDWKPSADGATVGLEVDDIKKSFEELKKKGVKIHMELQDFPSCGMFVIQDPDNNKIGIHQRKKK